MISKLSDEIEIIMDAIQDSMETISFYNNHSIIKERSESVMKIINDGIDVEKRIIEQEENKLIKLREENNFEDFNEQNG